MSTPPLPHARPAALALYRGASRLAEPLLHLWLNRRVAAGKEDGARLGERFGAASQPRPAGPLVWLHAASVGETMSVLALIGRLVERGTVLLTTGTLTSARLAAERLPSGALHQFVPVDTAGAVRRFLDHWRPDLAILTESEIWPNLIDGCHRRGIPLGIVNGRMSARSFRRWQARPAFAGALLRPLAFCLAQSTADAARYAALGAPAETPGNLKFDAAPLGAEASELARLRAEIGARPVLVAASTHAEEEAIIFAALAEPLHDRSDLLTIIVPRHPARGEAIARLAADLGFAGGRRSRGGQPVPGEALYIADTLGELGLFYRLATLAFIGGSLVPHGGHNPIEAIQLGAPVISGPHIGNFSGIFAELSDEAGAAMVSDAADLGRTVSRLLADEAARAALAAAAQRVVSRHHGALERTFVRLERLLPPRAAG